MQISIAIASVTCHIGIKTESRAGIAPMTIATAMGKVFTLSIVE